MWIYKYKQQEPQFKIIATKMLTQSLVIFAILNSIYAENKFMNSVRNLTRSSNSSNHSNQNTSEGNVLKVEVAKYLNECKSDLSYNYYGNEDETTNNKYDSRYEENNFRRRNKEHKRSDRGNRNFDDGDIDGYLTNYRRNDQNYRKQQKESCSDNDGGRHRNGHHRSNNDNVGSNRNFGNPYDSGGDYYNYRSNNYDNQPPNYGNPSNSHPGYNPGGMSNYPGRNGDLIRWKRERDNCVSQCVFGYMELLDENSTPSETATIKLLQDKMNNDRKRVKLIRDTRRCFAKLAITDQGDGCELSKILARCLKLDMD